MVGISGLEWFVDPILDPSVAIDLQEECFIAKRVPLKRRLSHCLNCLPQGIPCQTTSFSSGKPGTC